MKLIAAVFLTGLAFCGVSAEKLFLLAEDGFNEFLKQDFHRLNLDRGRRDLECKLSAFPEEGLVPVLRIGKGPVSENCDTVLFAVRGYIFYSNQENPVKGLTAEEANGILNGTFLVWSDTKVPLKQICYAGSENLKRKQHRKGDPAWVKVPDPGLALEMTAADLTAAAVIPLISAGTVRKGTKLLPVNGVLPTPGTVMDGTYPAAVRYFLSVRKDAPPEIREIYERLRSKETRIKLWNAGILPAVEGDWK